MSVTTSPKVTYPVIKVDSYSPARYDPYIALSGIYAVAYEAACAPWVFRTSRAILSYSLRGTSCVSP